MSGTGPNSQVVNSYLAQGQANQELGLENNATAYLNNAANTASTAAQLAYANWLSSLNSENMSAFTGALGGIISADAGMAANEQQQQFAPGNNLVAALTSAALNPSAYQPVNSTSTSGTTNATSQAPSAGGGGGSPSGGGGGGGTNNTPTPVTLNTTTKVDPNAGVVPLTKEQQAGLELGNAQSQSTNPTTGYGSSYAPGLPYANTYFPNGDGQYEFQAPTPNPNFNNGYDSQPSYGS
jgi:hypothetical protein